MKRVGLVVVGLLVACGNASATQDHDQEQTQATTIRSTTTVGLDNSVTNPREKTLDRGSHSLVVPSGAEGPSVSLPWGGMGIVKQAEVTKIVAIASLMEASDPRREALIAQGIEAAAPCRWLGVGPKRFSILAGLDCWNGLRR